MHSKFPMWCLHRPDSTGVMLPGKTMSVSFHCYFLHLPPLVPRHQGGFIISIKELITPQEC